MEIKKVQTKDLQEIKAIADSLVVTPKEPHRKTGFYDYSLSGEQYTRRSRSDMFLVCCRNQRLEGFCMAYDSDFVRQLIDQEPKLREDVVFRYLSKQQEDYVYLDQLAVKKQGTFCGMACACELIDKLKGVSKEKKSIVGVIPHTPWANQPSINFFTHQGANLVREIGTEENIVFGVYKLDLS